MVPGIPELLIKWNCYQILPDFYLPAQVSALPAACTRFVEQTPQLLLRQRLTEKQIDLNLGLAFDQSKVELVRFLLFFHELLDSCIHAVGHIDLTLGADGDHMRFAEFAESLAGLSGSSEDFPIEIQL